MSARSSSCSTDPPHAAAEAADHRAGGGARIARCSLPQSLVMSWCRSASVAEEQWVSPRARRFSSVVLSKTGSSSLPRGRCLSTIDDKPLRHLGPGDVVGDLAVLAPAPRSASATAQTACLVLRLRSKPFDEFLGDHPQIARSVITALANTAAVSASHR